MMIKFSVAGLVACCALALGVAAPAVAVPAAPSLNATCDSVKDEVVDMSKEQASPGAPYAVGIIGGYRIKNNGRILKCRGKALLSRGGRQSIFYGVKLIAGEYYVFLKVA